MSNICFLIIFVLEENLSQGYYYFYESTGHQISCPKPLYYTMIIMIKSTYQIFRRPFYHQALIIYKLLVKWNKYENTMVCNT